MPASNSKALLVILDGFGLADDKSVSAVDKASTPFIDSLFSEYPNTQLQAGGNKVGLPEGQFGNSEVGHLNIGAGRIVPQELTRINKDIREHKFSDNKVLKSALKKASERGRIHLMGLFSDGGVHSHNNHLYALMKMSNTMGIDDTYIHAFTDGRDTSPTSGQEYVEQFQQKVNEIGAGKIASIVGRYYAMDRDNRWDRTKKAYELLVNGKGKKADDPKEALKDWYSKDITDEFIKPTLTDQSSDSRIQEGDVVVFFNFRGDRARQLSRAFTEKNFEKFSTADIHPHFVTFTSYDDSFQNVEVAYPPLDLKNTLGEVVSNHHYKQLRIAETEKYAHVTYFLNGGVEKPNKGEERIIIPSPKVATYDLKPEMSAHEVTEALCAQLMTEEHQLCIINYANPDMVGHTGDMDAAIKAVETIDQELKKTLSTASEHGYKSLIIADHGNADRMIKTDGSPHTAHTLAEVPAILVNEPNASKMHNGILADVAPTLLKLMDIDQPEEMTGSALF